MTRAPTRRRILAISAAACALAIAGRPAAAIETRWRGRALGAAASLRIAGLAPEAAAPVLTAVTRELARLERIFSLYRPDSALSRLNAAGSLEAPPAELVELLGLCDRLHRATGGAFDPTVQPLFALHARHAERGERPGPAEIARARSAVGWTAVRFDSAAIRLDRPGAALTLNGIAQGFITDRVAGLLRQAGLADILVEAGEVAAFGRRPDGAPWSAGVAAPDGRLLRRLTLGDRALATSAPGGTVLDAAGRIGHIFDPGTGGEASAASVVAVSAPRAALADGLSTALCVLPAADRAAIIAAFPDTRIEIAI